MALANFGYTKGVGTVGRYHVFFKYSLQLSSHLTQTRDCHYTSNCTKLACIERITNSSHFIPTQQIDTYIGPACRVHNLPKENFLEVLPVDVTAEYSDKFMLTKPSLYQ